MGDLRKLLRRRRKTVEAQEMVKEITRDKSGNSLKTMKDRLNQWIMFFESDLKYDKSSNISDKWKALRAMCNCKRTTEVKTICVIRTEFFKCYPLFHKIYSHRCGRSKFHVTGTRQFCSQL